YSLKENLTVHDFMHHEREVVEMERRRILKNLDLHKIEYIQGQASFEDAHTIAIGSRKLTGQIILISTGSKPNRPAEISFDDVHTFDSDTFLQMDRIPKSLAVIGGGVIGCEYASIFMALGVEVTLVDGRDRLLPFLDNEISDRLRERLASLGMHFRFNDRPVKTENSKDRVRLTMNSGKILETEAALFAAGRRAAVDGLALEQAGLALNDRGYIPVNGNYQTSVSHIYAAGDVIGFARADKKLLGVSMIGVNSTELIHIGLTVLDKGLTIDEFIEQVFNYPTLSETYKYAAYDGLGNLAGHKLREG